ncbi:MAG: DUF6672 family protein [Sphaerochaetaceae bacterium]|jgi:hypothetical protein
MDKVHISRKIWIRLAVIVAILLVAVLMFLIGKQHTILLDNKTLEFGGETYKAFSIVEVQVDKEEQLELAARDRDKAVVTGQRHSITVLYMDANYEEIEKTWKFSVPLGEDMLLLSVPALVGGAEPAIWLTHYEPPVAAAAPVSEEVVVTEDAALLGDF